MQEDYDYGTEIVIHSAPTKKGMTFKYWQGSVYNPGDKYTVVEDHTFTAVWTANQNTNSDSKKVVNTGDKNASAGWTALLVLALISAMGLTFFRIRTQR